MSLALPVAAVLGLAAAEEGQRRRAVQRVIFDGRSDLYGPELGSRRPEALP